MSKAREMTKLAREYRQKGWLVEHTKSNHWRFVSPDGAVVHAAGTPKGDRCITNTRADLKRAERRDQTATKSL